jgi:hypothetical protein
MVITRRVVRRGFSLTSKDNDTAEYPDDVEVCPCC